MPHQWQGRRWPDDHDSTSEAPGAAHEAQQGLPRRRREDRRRQGSTPRSRPSRLAKETGSAKYDETVEVAFRLGVDPRKADQMVRGTVNLPHGTGKTARVIVFANGDKAEAAMAAGADEVGGDDLHREGRRRLARLRRRRRDPRPHGQGRSARQGARPARPDAEPEDRHRHPGRRPRPSPTSRAARSSSASTSTPTCTSSSARSPSTRSSSSRTTPPRSTRSCGSSRPPRRAATSRRRTLSTTMGPGIPLDSTRTRNLLEETVEA